MYISNILADSFPAAVANWENIAMWNQSLEWYIEWANRLNA